MRKIKPIDPELVFDETVAVQRTINADLAHDESLLLKLAHPLLGRGFQGNAKVAHHMKTVVDAANIKAKIFLPDKAYMDACVDVAGVREHLKGKKSSVPLYMIIRVATANKVDIEEESSREISGSVAGSVDAAPAILGLQAQAEVQASNTRNAASTLKIEEECDFAYRIREFSY